MLSARGPETPHSGPRNGSPCVPGLRSGPRNSSGARIRAGGRIRPGSGARQSTVKPYKRPCGAYQGSLKKIITAAEVSPPASESTEIGQLRVANAQLTTENAQLSAKIELLTGGNADAVKMGMLTTKAEMSEKLLEQFQAGLERGLAMVTGHGLRFSPPPSASQP